MFSSEGGRGYSNNFSEWGVGHGCGVNSCASHARASNKTITSQRKRGGAGTFAREVGKAMEAPMELFGFTGVEFMDLNCKKSSHLKPWQWSAWTILAMQTCRCQWRY
jgi:hypothetical protein